MGAGVAARLLGIVCEIRLAVLVGIVTDNLYGVLVCTHSTVGAKAVELGLICRGVAKCDFFRKRERRECNIVNDAYREVVLRHRKSEVLINADDLRRCGVFRCKAVASANNDGGVLLSVESVLDIEEQRLSGCARLFCTVKHGNALHCGRHSGKEVLDRERTVEVYAYKANLLTL